MSVCKIVYMQNGTFCIQTFQINKRSNYVFLLMNCRPSYDLHSLLWLRVTWQSVLSSSVGCIASTCCQRPGVWRMWCRCVLQQSVNIVLYSLQQLHCLCCLNTVQTCSVSNGKFC